MEEVQQLKYLGFVISDDAGNVANILDKKYKSISTIRSIILFKDWDHIQFRMESFI